MPFAFGTLALVVAGLWIGGFFGGARTDIEIVIVTTYIDAPFSGPGLDNDSLLGAA